MHAQVMASARPMTCVHAIETGRVQIVLYELVPSEGRMSILPKEISTHLLQLATTVTLFWQVQPCTLTERPKDFH